MPVETYKALLVANSTFPGDSSNLPKLEGPRSDPVLMHGALCNPEVGLFSRDNVRLVTERTMAEVLLEAEDFLANATRHDTLLLYYSGHGLLDVSGELFLCTRDTRSDRLRATAVKASDLRGMMDASAVGRMVVVLDCCHSGRFKGGVTPGALSGRGRFVVTSSRPDELANDAHALNHASLFTHHLVEGILRGAEDHNRDGVVTLSELYDYVYGALVAEGRQRPQKRFEGDGDVPVARRTPPPPPPDDDDDVTTGADSPILDVSPDEIRLDDINSDESLPPERVAVINRGGGDLHWVAQSSADWVLPVAEDGALVLHLEPRSGPNRANVYVRDVSGAVKTVRVSVRVVDQPKPPDGSTEVTDLKWWQTDGRWWRRLWLIGPVAMWLTRPTAREGTRRGWWRRHLRLDPDLAWTWPFVVGVGLGWGLVTAGILPFILGLVNVKRPERRVQALVLMAAAVAFWISSSLTSSPTPEG